MGQNMRLWVLKLSYQLLPNNSNAYAMNLTRIQESKKKILKSKT